MFLTAISVSGCGSMVTPQQTGSLEIVISKSDVRLFGNASMFVPKGQRFEVIQMKSGERVVLLKSSTFVFFTTDIGVVIDERNCVNGKHVSKEVWGWQIHEPKSFALPLDVRVSTPYPFCFEKV
jgi:hypothetical protein